MEVARPVEALKAMTAEDVALCRDEMGTGPRLSIPIHVGERRREGRNRRRRARGGGHDAAPCPVAHRKRPCERGNPQKVRHIRRADQGTGDYLAYPLYIGRRAGASLPFNGQIYGLIVRFGANLSAATITQTETWLGQRVSPTVNIPLWQSKTIYDRFEDTVLDRNNETIEVR